jgi:hypothetical protein
MVVAALAGAGLAEAKKKNQTTGPSTDMAMAEVRSRVYEYSERFAGVVETAADDIMFGTSDPKIARNALLWKINAIPACHLAVFQSNPLAGAIDVWALAAQMADFFSTGNGRDLFGEWQPVAVEASSLLETEIRVLARVISPEGDLARADSFLESWAGDHPLDDLNFVRVSTRPLMAGVLGDRKGGAFAAVGRLEEQLVDLSERLTIYTGVLPRHARWQAQLLYTEIIQAPDVAEAIENTTALRVALERTADEVDQVPTLINAQVAAVAEVLREQIDKALADVDRQRLDTLKLLQEERAIILEAVTRERLATIEVLEVERAHTIEEVDELAATILDETTLRVERLVDRLFWRACWLVGALVAVAFVGGLVALRMLIGARPA